MEESVISECISNEKSLPNSNVKPRKRVREIYRDKILKLNAVYREETDEEGHMLDKKLNFINDASVNNSESRKGKRGNSHSVCSGIVCTETDSNDLAEVKSEKVEIKIKPDIVDVRMENMQEFSGSSQVKNENKIVKNGLVGNKNGLVGNKNELIGNKGKKLVLNKGSKKTKKTLQTSVIATDKLFKKGPNSKSANCGPYVCCECSESFYEPATLRVHIMKHSGYKMYSCAECFKQFTALSTLRSHMRVHTGEMPYKCDICGRRFMFAGNLYKHNIVHNTKPEDHHVCKICGLSVKYSANLHHHMRIHTGETRYQCELCEKQFIMRSGYTAHMRVHIGKKEFKCSVCSRMFMDRSALKSHSRTHSGEQPYGCLECPRRFSNTSNLNRHVRSRHSGIKPYECRTCGKLFTNANSVRYHDVLHAREQKEKSQLELRRKETKTEIS